PVPEPDRPGRPAPGLGPLGLSGSDPPEPRWRRPAQPDGRRVDRPTIAPQRRATAMGRPPRGGRSSLDTIPGPPGGPRRIPAAHRPSLVRGPWSPVRFMSGPYRAFRGP